MSDEKSLADTQIELRVSVLEAAAILHSLFQAHEGEIFDKVAKQYATQVKAVSK